MEKTLEGVFGDAGSMGGIKPEFRLQMAHPVRLEYPVSQDGDGQTKNGYHDRERV
ncbi:hypothetical protein MASR2M48_16310 [Spirochaetota bacterium]